MRKGSQQDSEEQTRRTARAFSHATIRRTVSGEKAADGFSTVDRVGAIGGIVPMGVVWDAQGVVDR